MKIKEKVLNTLEIKPKFSNFNKTKVERAVELTLHKVSETIDEVLTNTRRKVNEEIKDEQSIAHSHTAINQIEDGLKKELGI